MNGRLQTRRVETVHCLILGLSMFLVGLYFGTSLPAGVDLVVLQTGLIGFLNDTVRSKQRVLGRSRLNVVWIVTLLREKFGSLQIPLNRSRLNSTWTDTLLSTTSSESIAASTKGVRFR